jgi:hypothetical protein
MAQWLQADLAAANAEWIIAFWHHPPYSKGTHDSDTESYMYNMRQNMVPILEAGGVDIVLTGHSHNYERSFFLDGHYGWSWEFDSSMIVQGGDGRVGGNGAYTKPPGSAANEGAVYAVVGASGQAPSSAPLNHPAMIFSSLLHGSMVIDIDGDRLDARYLTKTGTIYDWFTIEKPGTSEPTAPVLGQIPDQTAIQGVPYTGPAPQLQQGSQPVDFTLDQAPSGMTIDEGSGVVTWPDPE